MKRRHQGAVLVMVAILIVVLIGVAALALDISRLLVLRSEMHNAVDAVALAAAAELNGGEQAQARAKHAAKTLLQHDAKFSRLRELLDDSLTVCEGGEVKTNCEIYFEFFCAIENNITAPNIPTECKNGLIGGTEKDANKILAQGDDDTHYVRVTLNPEVTQGGDEERYSIDLYFLPVLRAIGIDVPSEASTSATALAGRSFVICKYPPLMICNPYEGVMENGQPKKLTVGQQIKLYMGASSPGYWAPGDFGLLEPPTGKGGAVDVSEYIAGEGLECTEPYITTKTGVQVNMIKWGLNTRFGIYEYKYKPDDYPPAMNVLDFPRDPDLDAVGTTNRIGKGDWSRPAYWNAYHSGSMPTGMSTRYDFYKWELENNTYPLRNDAATTTDQCEPIAEHKPEIDQCNNYKILKGQPDQNGYLSALNRRVITVPVINCASLGVSGKEKDMWVAQEEYWKKFFITEHVYSPSDGVEIFAEYIGNAGNRDGTFHVDVKLYE